MGRIIFNEDPNHFIYSRYTAGYKSITEKDCEDFILQYKDTDITDFMICVNASVTWYDCSCEKNIISQYREYCKSDKKLSHIHNTEYIGLLADFYDRYKKVPQDIWIETLRKIGVRPWTSIRMNDIHESDLPDSILFSDFYRANRKKNRASHRGAAGYYEYGLDYTYEEVRKHYLEIIEDALRRFDTDGLELDWMREIYSVGIGKEHEGTTVINRFMRDVYVLVKDIEKVRGHNISIAVRLPDTPEKALRLGFDAFDWVENGLVDMITVTPRWSSVDNDLPIDIWKKTFRGKPVCIAAGLEILLDAYNRKGRKYVFNTFETAISSACAYLYQGADAIYLFNYMDKYVDYCTGEAGKKFFKTVGNYERCIAEKRRHILTYNDVSAIGVPQKKPLPAKIFRGEYAAFRIVTGEIPQGRNASIILGIEAGSEFNASALSVYASARKCIFADEIPPAPLQYTDMRYFAFNIKNDGSLPPGSVIEIGGADCILHWLEIDII